MNSQIQRKRLGVIAIALGLLMPIPAHSGLNPTTWVNNGTQWLADAKKGVDSHDVKRAVRGYKKAMRFDDTRDEAVVALGNYVASLGDTATAARLLERYNHDDNPFNIDAEMLEADTRYQTGDLIGATRVLDLIESLRPGYLPASELRGAVMFEVKEYDDAIANLTAYLKEFPSGQRARLIRGKAYVAIGKYETAVNDLKILTSKYPDDVKGLTTLGEAYLGAGHLQDADRVLHQALRLNPSDSAVYEQLAMVQVQINTKSGNTAQMMSFFQKAIELDPKNLEMGNKLGQLYMQKRMFTQAEAEFHREYTIDPTFEPCVHGWVDSLTAQNKWDVTGQVLREYTQNHPDQTWATVKYAELLIRIHQFDTAQGSIKRNRSKAGESFESSILEANLKLGQGKAQEALAILYDADKKYPGKPELIFNIAKMEEEVGNYDVAVPKYREVTGDPAMVHKAQLNLAVMLEKMGNVSESLEIFRTVAKAADKDETLRTPEKKALITTRIAALESVIKARDEGRFQDRLPASDRVQSRISYSQKDKK